MHEGFVINMWEMNWINYIYINKGYSMLNCCLISYVIEHRYAGHSKRKRMD